MKKIDTLGTASTKDVPVSGNASTSQVVMGNDTRLSDARPASDVSAWAKANSKPSYNASEVGAEPYDGTSTGNKIFNVGGKLQLRTDPEGGNITLTPPDGKHPMEMDIYDNANLRMYFWDVDNQTMSGAITKSVSGFANLDDIVSKVNRFRDSFSNDDARVPLSGSTHLNDIATTCFVNGAGTANGFPTDDWYFVITFIHSSNPVYRTQIAFSMTGANNINKTYTRMCQATSWSSWQQFADKSDISTLQSNFQAGVDSIYNACVAKGSTPASKSLSDVVAGIGNIPTNSYSTQTKTVTLSSSSLQPWTDDWYYGSTSLTFDFTHGVLGVVSISGVNFYTNGFAGPTSISGNTVNIGFTVHDGSKSMTITVYGY